MGTVVVKTAVESVTTRRFTASAACPRTPCGWVSLGFRSNGMPPEEIVREQARIHDAEHDRE